jgi:hypothetical protein
MRHYGGCFIGLMFAALSVANGGSAVALQQNNILGKWCGVRANPNWVNIEFTRDKMTITHLPGNEPDTLKIDRFEFTEDTVIVHYFAAGALNGVPGKDPFHVTYGNFGADGKTMVQLHNSVQPRDAYYTRC